MAPKGKGKGQGGGEGGAGGKGAGRGGGAAEERAGADGGGGGGDRGETWQERARREALEQYAVLERQRVGGRPALRVAGTGAGAALVLLALVFVAILLLPAPSTKFNARFHDNMWGKVFSPEFFNMTMDQCGEKPFCRQILAGKPDACAARYPYVAGEVYRSYRHILSRDPEAWGLDWWCRAIVKGDFDVGGMRMRMLMGGERRNEKRHLIRMPQALCELNHMTCSLLHMPWGDWSVDRTPGHEFFPGGHDFRLMYVNQHKALKAGETNVAKLSERLLVTNTLWENTAKTLDRAFCSNLCRWPSSKEDFQVAWVRMNRWLRGDLDMWDIEGILAESPEAHWCSYKRILEGHADVLAPKSRETRKFGWEKCVVPQESYLPPDEVQELACYYLFQTVMEAVQSNTTAVREGDVLRTRENKTLIEAERFVKRAYMGFLKRAPQANEIQEHIALMMAWRRSELTVSRVIRGSDEYQFKSWMADALTVCAAYLLEPESSYNTTALFGMVLDGLIEFKDGRLHFGQRSTGGDAANVAILSRFERVYGAAVGAFSIWDDFLRMRIIGDVVHRNVTLETALETLTGVCEKDSDFPECLECDGYPDDDIPEVLVTKVCCCRNAKDRVEAMKNETARAASALAEIEAVQRLRQRFGYRVINGNKFKWDKKRATAIIVVYVHRRPDYFAQMLDGLRKAKGIERALLVVSMDGVYDEMLDVVETIDFCRVRLLLHTKRQRAPHLNGILAIKEHWWWMQEQVWFNTPEVTDWDRTVLFLEEDHVVSPDALSTAALMETLLPKCQGCWGFSLRFGCGQDKVKDSTVVCSLDGFINTAYAFNRTIYKHLHHDQYWSFRDGWDWSIFHMMQKKRFPFRQLAPGMSRVRNIGVEGSTVRSDTASRFLNYTIVSDSTSPPLKSYVHKHTSMYGGTLFKDLPYYLGTPFPKPYSEEV